MERLEPGTMRPKPDTGWGVALSEAPADIATGDIMKARELIRDEIRATRSAASVDHNKLRALQHAEDTMSGTIESSMGPEARAALRDTDKRYSIYSTIEDAAGSAGAKEQGYGFGQLHAAIRRNVGRRAAALNRTDLGQAARHGAATFEEMPMTGGRIPVISSIPVPHWAKGWAEPLIARSTNQPLIQNALFGGSFKGGGGALIENPKTRAAALAAALRLQEGDH
jgi:hypothetical protein